MKTSLLSFLISSFYTFQIAADTMKVNLEQEFADNTTLHGISRVHRSKSVFVKAVWTLVCLTAFGLFAWILTKRVTEYFRYEVTTLVKVGF